MDEDNLPRKLQLNQGPIELATYPWKTALPEAYFVPIRFQPAVSVSR